MEKSKKIKKAANGKIIAGGNSGKTGTKGAADTVESKNSKEVKKLANQKAKNEKRNAEKIANKAMEAEKKIARANKIELQNLCKEKKAVVWTPKNKSQLETIRIIEEGEEAGLNLTVEDARMIKQERKIRSKIVHPVQSVHYFKTLEQRVGSGGMCIILTMDVVVLILAKCPMPKNAAAYLTKAKSLYKAQIDNTFSYFTPPFSGLPTMNTDIGLLDTAIQNYNDDDGTGNTETIIAAVKEVQQSVDALVVYVNKICRGNQVDALAIIAAAKMEPVKQREKGKKPDFQIKQGAASGEIILIALANKVDGKRVPSTYYWQYGLKVGGVWVWTDLPNTTDKCQTTATGMPVDETVAFRKSTSSTKGGRSAWCTPITITPK